MDGIRRELLAAALVLACAGCATVERAAVAPPSTVEREYGGIGEDPSLLGAMDHARADAVRLAVLDLIGAAAEQANRALLSRRLYDTRESGAFVIGGSFVTIREERNEEGYLVEARVTVRVDAVSEALRSLGLSGGPAAGPAATPSAPPSGKSSAAGAAVAAGAAPSGAAIDVDRLVRERVENLTWLVSFVDRGGVAAPALRAATLVATEYLLDRAMRAVEPSRLEALVTDKRKAWASETDGSVGSAPWAARRLAADVYLEIDGAAATSRSQDRWSASASIEVRIYEVSTARLLASVPWTSSPGEWHRSAAAAVGGALQAAVARIMPLAVSLAKARFAAELRRTIASAER